MDDEEVVVIPVVVDPLVLEESAIVSDTDAALHSSEDEGGSGVTSYSWLSSHDVLNNRVITRARTPVDTSTTSAQDHDDDDDDGNDSVNEDEMKESAAAGSDDFYCSNLDDEDEAYVYKHLRSGREETLHVRRMRQQQQNEEQQGDNSSKMNLKSSGKTSSSKEATTQTNNPSQPSTNNLLQQARLLKPRTSDAILSCPRCFNVVCMDCQQHERYANQYRAMFVMNIGVDWTKKMMYDDVVGGLKARSSNITSDGADDAGGGSGGGRSLEGRMEEEGDEEEDEDESMPDRIPHDDIVQSRHATNTNAVLESSAKKEVYYAVHCSYCTLELAALDMDDEIYYFFGCIASS